MIALEQLLATVPVLSDDQLAQLRSRAAEEAKDRRAILAREAVIRVVDAGDAFVQALRAAGALSIGGEVVFAGGPDATTPAMRLASWKIPSSDFETLQIRLTGHLRELMQSACEEGKA